MPKINNKNLEASKRTKKENFSTIARLVKNLKEYRFALIGGFLLTILSNTFSLIAPKMIQKCISFIELPAEEIIIEKVFNFAMLMLFFYILTFLLSMLLSYVMMNLGQVIGYKLRKDSFNKFEKLPVSYFDTHQTGDIISRFTYDIDLISSSLGQNCVSFATSLITMVGSFSMMMSINLSLMTSLFVTVVISLSLGAYWMKKVRFLHLEKSIKMGELNGYIEDKITGHKTIKIYGQEANILKKLELKNQEWAKAHYNSEFKGGNVFRNGLNFVTNSSTATLYVHSCILYLNGNISLAEISSFILYAKMFTGIINEITFVIADLQSALAASDRVFDFLDEEEEIHDTETSVGYENCTGLVEFNDLNFSYNKDRVILNNINFVAKPNDVIAIVGHTGAGKTSLINLLMRFYEPSSGEILFDSNNIASYRRDSLRSNCAMVLQDAWLFGGTVFENIVYGNDNATFEDVLTITKAISLHDHIMNLPKGYETEITENTVNISQGQKQLITIARAMLLDAKILILDEATSNIDTLTEINVQNAMDTLMKDKTSFVIAHRLSTIRNATNILVLEKGKIIESGNHSQLLNLNGYYSNLYKYSKFKLGE